MRNVSSAFGEMLITKYAVFEEGIFMRSISKSFFDGDMAHFFKVNQNRVKKNTRGSNKLTYESIESSDVLALVGESITNFLSESATKSHADVAVEDLNGGTISSSLLRKWTSQLPRLRMLRLVGAPRACTIYLLT